MMDSVMEIDDSNYKQEVIERNRATSFKPILNDTRRKRPRALFEIDLPTKASEQISLQISQYQQPQKSLSGRISCLEHRTTSSPKHPLSKGLSNRLSHSTEASRDTIKTRPALRRIGGFVVTILSCGFNLLSAIWNSLEAINSPKTNIVAVSTDETGRKRRAITVPQTSIMATPPDSRPGSQQEPASDDPEDVSWSFNPDMTIPTLPTLSDLGAPDATLPGSHSELKEKQIDDGGSLGSEGRTLKAKRSVKQQENTKIRTLTPPSSVESITDRVPIRSRVDPTVKIKRDTVLDHSPGDRQTGVPLHSDRFPICQDRSNDFLRPTFKYPLQTLSRHARPLPAFARLPHTIRKAESNTRVDSLVERANKLKLGTEEQQKVTEAVRSTFRRRRAEEEQRVAEELEKARVAAEKETQAKRAAAALKEKKEAERVAKLAEEELKRQAAVVVKKLEPKWVDKLQHAMKTTTDKVLAQGPEGIDLTRRDFGTLLAAPGASVASAWLNDEIVNAWYGFLVREKLEQRQHTKGTAAPYAAYHTAWYGKMRDEGPESLKRWSRRKGIQNEKLLQAEKIFMPINTGNHWILLIISPKARSLEVLDSMRGSAAKYFSYARDWLEMELAAKYKAEEWTESKSASSLQDNCDDCGAFTCLNGFASATEKPYKAVTAGNMQDARRMIGAVLLNGGFTGDFAF